jgi:VIT1/CCC1 family predicted Fe2+/Mn2+ transporter
MATQAAIKRYLINRQAEVDGAYLYRSMSDTEPRPHVASVYRRLAEVEERHAGFWEERLRAAGHSPGPRRPSGRARILAWLARRLGAAAVLPTVAAEESRTRNDYLPQPETHGTSMTNDERTHARVLRNLVARNEGVEGSTVARLEGRHRAIGGNALRAAVLGANDGLSSNLSLVMGVSGATVDHHVILITGLAGLLAGACSMALGEWVSVTSSRELAEREMSIEREELREHPEEEREELRLIYESKGLSPQEASELSGKLVADPQTALDALSREELGINPEDLGGSAAVAAISSLLLFALGAVIPVVPFFFLTGTVAVGASLGAGALALFGIGAAITLFTGRSAWFSGARQLVLGLLAAGVTYGIGRAIGVVAAG